MITAASFLAIVGLMSFLGYQPQGEFIKFYLVGTVLIPIAFTLWLIIFNSWKNKVDEYSIEFTEHDIRYIHFGDVETISWDTVESYKVGGFFTKTLTIIGKERKIAFDFNIFDTKQREGIISNLNEKC